MNRFFPVDKYGSRIVSRKQQSSRPEHIPSQIWWKDFTPVQRAQWHKDMREREAKESASRAVAVSRADETVKDNRNDGNVNTHTDIGDDDNKITLFGLPIVKHTT